MKTCSIEGCERKHESRGYCKQHARQDREGRLVRKPFSSLDKRTQEHTESPDYIWRGGPTRKEGTPDYFAQHMRMKNAMGSASNHDCVDCGGQARHWSYNGQDPDELTTPNRYGSGALLVYSTDVAYYEPRCGSCHQKYDRAMRKERDAVKTGECSHDGCEREPESRGMCHTHYMQWYRAQDEEVQSLVGQLDHEQGDPTTFACYWCDLYDDETNAAVAWFMGEACCKPHLRLGQRWAAFALRSAKVGA